MLPEVVLVVESENPLKLGDIARLVGKAKTTVNTNLQTAVNNGIIEKVGRGLYQKKEVQELFAYKESEKWVNTWTEKLWTDRPALVLEIGEVVTKLRRQAETLEYYALELAQDRIPKDAMDIDGYIFPKGESVRKTRAKEDPSSLTSEELESHVMSYKYGTDLSWITLEQAEGLSMDSMRYLVKNDANLRNEVETFFDHTINKAADELWKKLHKRQN